MSPIAPLGSVSTRVFPHGKFLGIGEQRFLVKGVAYGTFAPDESRGQFPTPERVAEDLALMARVGINTVRLYSLPPLDLLDEMARCGDSPRTELARALNAAMLHVLLGLAP